MTDWILVDRFVDLYDPLGHVGLEDADLADIQDILPVAACIDRAVLRKCPSRRKDLGRVRYFLEVLLAGGAIDAIEVDNETSLYAIGGPVLIDGHHRLIAAWLAGRRRVSCRYSGRVDILRWLKGKGKKPRDL
jgi:hypothetical protein